jgi:hypothetical protein
MSRLSYVQRARFCLSHEQKNNQDEEKIKIGIYNIQGGSRQKKAPPTHRSVKIIIIAIMKSISPKIQILGTKLFLGEMLFIIDKQL